VQVRINSEGHHLGTSSTASLHTASSAATGDVMQWAKESHDLAATAAYDGLSNGGASEDAYISKASPGRAVR
jgi:hypothetical protein